jgi:hypothetical protein
MMRYRVAIFVLLAALGTFAKQKSLEELKAEIGKVKGGRQAEAFAQLAQRLVEVANQQFAQAKSEEAHQTIQEVLECATQAHDIALQTRKKRKEVEIHLRETQRQMENVRRTLAAVDRPALETVERKLADYRQDLLDSMFAPKKKKEKTQ